MLYSHSEYLGVAALVANGSVDAWILKTCELESLMVEHNISADAFRILDEHKTPRSPAGIRVPSIPGGLGEI